MKRHGRQLWVCLVLVFSVGLSVSCAGKTTTTAGTTATGTETTAGPTTRPSQTTTDTTGTSAETTGPTTTGTTSPTTIPTTTETSPPVEGALHSLASRGFLPDGTEFLTWEPEVLTFTKTYYVDQGNPLASDDNPGTKQRPFLTINRAAQVLQPGEQVLVESGVYREWVNPARGGTDAQHMISYEAAPGADVVIKGSDILKANWVDQGMMAPPSNYSDAPSRKVWMVRLPRELFIGYNPFGLINYPQVNEMGFWDLKTIFGKSFAPILLQVRGLIFQDGRPLEQVDKKTDLAKKDGTFWADMNGLVLYATTIGDIDPNGAKWEVTTREQCFAPEEQELNYIRVKGFTMEHAGNGFPFPQRGLLSATLGTHWIIEDNTIRWANSIGIDIGMQGTGSSVDFGHQIVRRNIISDCGICGIAGAPMRDALIEDNLLSNDAWLDTEGMAECAAMKFHWSTNVLIRRNLIVNIPHGSGIYLDCQNTNCRITQNSIIGVGSLVTMAPGPGQGAIYLEANSGPAMVDNNFIWGSTRTNGIYGYFSGNTVIANNLIGQCVAGGIVMIDEAGRPDGNKGGGINIVNNILVGNGWNIDLLKALGNASDFNVFGQTIGSGKAIQVWTNVKDTIKELQGTLMTTFPQWSFYEWRLKAGAFNMWQGDDRVGFAEWQSKCGMDLHSVEADVQASFNPDTYELTWSVKGNLPACRPVAGIYESFSGQALPGGTNVAPGPFGTVPQQAQTILVDPRQNVLRD